MAGVLRLIMNSQRQPAGRSEKAQRMNPKALELETAKEILTEVFCIEISDVDEMIQSRFRAIQYEASGRGEGGLWPAEFWLAN